jgi:hypothetical protein
MARRQVLRTTILGGLALGSMSLSALGAVPVVPGAVGFGVNTSAGRGGTIYRVTNLNDSGPGTLRACIEASGPRVCVFEVSGVIRWSSTVFIKNPNLTIAGQTAPAPGIMVRGGLNFEAPDVLIQHMTFRRGEDFSGKVQTFWVNNYSGKLATNIVIDHCTITWGIGTTLAIYAGFGDVTVSNSIIAEGLNDSPANEYEGYGFLIGPEPTGRVSVVNNLFAHNAERNPLSKTAELVFVNNMVYDYIVDATRLQNGIANGDTLRTKNSIVGNLYVRGPSYGAIAANSSKPIWFDSTMASSGNRTYLHDNASLMSSLDAPTPPADPWSLTAISAPNTRGTLEVGSPPTWPAGLLAKPVGQVKEYVLANAGARPAERSAQDSRLITNARQGTGRFSHCVNPSSYYAGSGWIAANLPNCDRRNAGGWPVLAQNTRQLTVPANPSGDDDGDGYTALEEWLHDFAAQVEGAPETAQPTPPTDLTVE